jgi:hypothetical protein
MKTKTITTSREKFSDAVNAARETEKLFPGTRVAYYCERFSELNKGIIKAGDKEILNKMKPLNRKESDFWVEKCIRDDKKVAILNDKGGYQFDVTPQKEVNKNADEIQAERDVIIDAFLEQEIEVQVFENTMELPEKFDFLTTKQLNGFVFLNVSEFEKEFNTETKAEA